MSSQTTLSLVHSKLNFLSSFMKDMTSWVLNEEALSHYLVLRFILYVLCQSAWLPLDTDSHNLSLLLTIALYLLESSTL